LIKLYPLSRVWLLLTWGDVAHYCCWSMAISCWFGVTVTNDTFIDKYLLPIALLVDEVCVLVQLSGIPLNSHLCLQNAKCQMLCFQVPSEPVLSQGSADKATHLLDSGYPGGANPGRSLSRCVSCYFVSVGRGKGREGRADLAFWHWAVSPLVLALP
jgi:hypothetical protein